jgi:chemotaxis protein histidine kinase CheA
MSNTPEPALDMSEILGLYKEDTCRMIAEMQAAAARWNEVASGGQALGEIRRLSHQLRGSGRTYGFRNVTRVSKALERIAARLEKRAWPADERVRLAVHDKIGRLAAIFEL